ncbi:hypothetical protein ACFLYU_05420 [Candidatus Dependentiae bacterium]
MKKLLNLSLSGLLAISLFATIDVNCMHRKMFKRSYKQKNYISKKRRPKKVRPRVKKRVIARETKRIIKQQEESSYRQPRPKVSRQKFKPPRTYSYRGYRGCKILQNPFIFSLIMFLLLFNRVGTIKVIPREAWPSTVREGCPDFWNNKPVLGSREQLPDGSMFGCNIEKNYTITCCASNPFRCISFDIGGIIGEQYNSSAPMNITEDIIEARRMCIERSKTYNVANEAKTLMQLLQNSNGTQCTIKIFKPDFTKFYGTIDYILILTRNSPKLSCAVRIWDLEKIKMFPDFVKMIKELSQKLHIKTPKMFIFSDRHCNQLVTYKAMRITFKATNNYGKEEEFIGVAASYNLLQKHSDNALKEVFGHEITHSTQKYHKTGNQDEVEADIGSVLINKNPCFAFHFKNDRLPALIPTRKNINEALKPHKKLDNLYPPSLARKLVIIRMHKHYGRTRALLLLTGKKWPY